MFKYILINDFRDKIRRMANIFRPEEKAKVCNDILRKDMNTIMKVQILIKCCNEAYMSC